MPNDFDIDAIAVDQIPALIIQLAARMAANGAVAAPAEPVADAVLLDARQMAERLGVPESWVRTEARAGRIPSVEVGRYVRFREADVMAALAAKQTALVIDNHSALVNHGRGGNHCHENQTTQKSRGRGARTLGRPGKERSEDSGSAS
jgi:excisionase family DNA binding protein